MCSVVQKQNTQRAFAAMAGNGGAGNRFDNFVEMIMAVDCGASERDNLGACGRVSNENALGVGIIEHIENVVDVLIDDSGSRAAVLFTDYDFAVFKEQRGLKLERGREERSEPGASAALIKVFHGVDEERSLDERHALEAQLVNLLGGILAAVAKVAGIENEQSGAGRERPAVHNEHVLEVLCRKLRVMVSCGNIAGYAEVHYAVVGVLFKSGKKLAMLFHASRGGLRKNAVFIHELVDFVGSDGNAVLKAFAAQHHGERKSRDVSLLKKNAEVAGRIR